MEMHLSRQRSTARLFLLLTLTVTNQLVFAGENVTAQVVSFTDSAYEHAHKTVSYHLMLSSENPQIVDLSTEQAMASIEQALQAKGNIASQAMLEADVIVLARLGTFFFLKC